MSQEQYDVLTNGAGYARRVVFLQKKVSGEWDMPDHIDTEGLGKIVDHYFSDGCLR
jgi:hypothetical protein